MNNFEIFWLFWGNCYGCFFPKYEGSSVLATNTTAWGLNALLHMSSSCMLPVSAPRWYSLRAIYFQNPAMAPAALALAFVERIYGTSHFLCELLQ